MEPYSIDNAGVPLDRLKILLAPEAISVGVAYPYTVILSSVGGLTSTYIVAPKLIITASPAAGAPFGDQFMPVLHAPLITTHVFVAPEAMMVRPRISVIRIIARKIGVQLKRVNLVFISFCLLISEEKESPAQMPVVCGKR